MTSIASVTSSAKTHDGAFRLLRDGFFDDQYLHRHLLLLPHLVRILLGPLESGSWFPCFSGVFLIVMVYSHLAARIPITGFAYQWNSRLTNSHYGWFTGCTAMLRSSRERPRLRGPGTVFAPTSGAPLRTATSSSCLNTAVIFAAAT